MHSNSLNNLIPFDEMDTERHRELSARGGKVSGTSRRHKRKMREFFTLAMECIARSTEEARTKHGN